MFECLKFMRCVGTIAIDCLPIEQHIMSRKHYANAPFWLTGSWFLDESTWGISSVKQQGIPPSWITWSRPCGIQCMDVSLTDITYRSTSYSAFIQQDTIRWPPPSIIHFFMRFKDAAAYCSYLITEQTMLKGTSNGTHTVHLRISLCYTCNKVLHQQWLWHVCLMKGYG